MLTAAAVLIVFGVLHLGMGFSEIVGKIAIQMVPGTLGSLLARSQFGKEAKDSEEDDTLSVNWAS